MRICSKTSEMKQTETHWCDTSTWLIRIALRCSMPYCEEDVNGEYSNDNTEEESDTYTLTLNLPMSVSKHSMDKISDLLHEYIVCKVISEWCLIAFPSLATMWATKAEDCRAKIKSTHNRRTKPVRRRKTPF